MIRIPIDNFVFRSFTTKTIKLDLALNDLDESMHVLFVELPASECHFLVIEKKQVTQICHVTDTLDFYGNKTLEYVSFQLEREKSILTLGKVSEPLSRFYQTLLSSSPEQRNIDTEYFSFWRFVSYQKQNDTHGIGSISGKDATIWTIFESGELTGGWMVKNSSDPPLSLSVDRVLEEAVKTSGTFNFFKQEKPLFMEVKPTSVFIHTDKFSSLVMPNSKERLLAQKTIGELGLDVGCLFDGKLMVSEIAAQLRIPEVKVLAVARFLYSQMLIARY